MLVSAMSISASVIKPFSYASVTASIITSRFWSVKQSTPASIASAIASAFVSQKRWRVTVCGKSSPSQTTKPSQPHLPFTTSKTSGFTMQGIPFISLYAVISDIAFPSVKAYLKTRR
jgi:hypothetical protein